MAKNFDFQEEVPWKEISTINGYNSKVLFSVLNKELRRAEVENALAVAHELVSSSERHIRKLWQRLLIVSAEDVGLGDTDAFIHVYELFLQYLEDRIKIREDLVIDAVIRLCFSEKDRSADEVFNVALAKVLSQYKQSPFWKKDHIEIVSAKKITFLGRDLNESLKAFLDKMSHGDLKGASELAVEIVFGGTECELELWNSLKQYTVTPGLDYWNKFVTLTGNSSKLMKIGKNDRYMGLILSICGIVLDIHPPLYKSGQCYVARGVKSAINIPDYALDMHSKTERNFVANVEDFRQFWTKGSILSNQKRHVVGNEYIDWILANLDIFVEIRPIREKMLFID